MIEPGQSSYFLASRVKEHGGRTYILVDIIIECFTKGCGGKLCLTVCVGHIENGRYIGNKELKLPSSIICTNCKGSADLPKETVNILLIGINIFTKDLTRITQGALNAHWN